MSATMTTRSSSAPVDRSAARLAASTACALSVTVVIPALNRARYLRATIDSVLEQDHPRVECIVVDGGSTDGSIEILKSYGQRIRWISEPDRGHSDAINKGWRMGSGDVLAWLNADDTWAGPHAARRACEYLTDHPDVDVVYGDCYEIDERGRRVGWEYLREFDLAYAVEHCDHCIPQAAAFIRRRAIRRVGELDLDFYQKKDHELWLRIAVQGRIAHLPEPLGAARNVQGLSFDGRTAAPACVQVTRRLLSLPDVPPRIRQRAGRALSNAYLRGLDYAYDGGPLWGLMWRCAGLAIWEDPSNWRAAAGRMRRYLARSRGKQRFDPAAEVDRLLVPWITLRTPSGAGRALVVEENETDLPLAVAMRGWTTTATAPAHRPWPFSHENLRFTRDPIDRLALPEGGLGLIVERLARPAERWLRPRLLEALGDGGLWCVSKPWQPEDSAYIDDQVGLRLRDRCVWRRDGRGRWLTLGDDDAPAAGDWACYLFERAAAGGAA